MFYRLTPLINFSRNISINYFCFLDFKVKIMNVQQDNISKFILNQDLAIKISDNIGFVEKYFNQVEIQYPDRKEQEIVYKHLGAIVYSCIEATWKSVISEINKHCETRQCSEKECPYRLKKNLNKLSSREAFCFLLDARFFGFTMDEINRINQLADLRNYIHLSKYIDGTNYSDDFKKEYVVELLGYYYKIVEQLDTANWFFSQNDTCLKSLDSNGYESTKEMRINDSNSYYFYRFLLVIDTLFDKEELTRDDKWILSKIKVEDMDDSFLKDVIDHILYRKRFYKRDEEYHESLQRFYDYLKENNQLKLKNRIEEELEAQKRSVRNSSVN